MAGWVPFRCQTVADTFTMWGRMIDITSLSQFKFTLAPNAYFVAAALLLGMMATWAWVTYAEPASRHWRSLRFVGETGYNAAGIALVILFLQVRGQFIYFQF